MVFCRGLIVETEGIPATSAGIRPLGAQHPIQTVFICKTRCPASTSKADLFPLLFPQASPDTFCTTSIDLASHHLPRDEGSPITLVLGGVPKGVQVTKPHACPRGRCCWTQHWVWMEPSWSPALPPPRPFLQPNRSASDGGSAVWVPKGLRCDCSRSRLFSAARRVVASLNAKLLH